MMIMNYVDVNNVTEASPCLRALLGVHVNRTPEAAPGSTSASVFTAEAWQAWPAKRSYMTTGQVSVWQHAC